jgi:toxin ParE1/3/4
MPFKIFWSVTAELRLLRIHRYYCDKVGIKVANKLVRDVVSATIRLGHQPNIGPIEPHLKGMTTEYRYLVEGNYKVIYSVNEELREVNVADVFDCRQNPTSMLKG